MMNMSAEPDDWGARRLEEREATRRKVRWDLVGGALLVPVAIVLVDAMTRGFAPRAGGRPVWMVIALAIGMVVVIGYAAWRTARDEDELQRRITVNSLAAVGGASVLLNLAADNLHELVHYELLRHHIFLATLVIGFAAYGWQRWRS